ncbi:MAG: protein-L-isoaspartate(D-aspartate) O-methyltransferase [Alphaproteobacteria bacterium]
MSDEARRIRLIMELRRQGITDTRVLSAIERVPREIFVPPAFHDQAYENIALPIASGQTISQPLVVAAMTEALEVGEKMKVLEVGTGSGYQAAVLAHLCRRVYTIERHRDLLEAAERCFAKLKLTNIVTKLGDGSKGWPEQAPFDRIIVTAGARDAPQPLLDQLGVGGIMVIPLASNGRDQDLYKIRRGAEGYEREAFMPVRFVPLVTGAPDETRRR